MEDGKCQREFDHLWICIIVSCADYEDSPWNMVGVDTTSGSSTSATPAAGDGPNNNQDKSYTENGGDSIGMMSTYLTLK